jgi:phospholipase/carboxylesterase
VSVEATTVERGGLRALSVGDPAAGRVVVLLHGFLMQPSDLAPFAHSLMVPGWFLFPEGPISISAAERAWWYMDPVARAEAIACGPRDFAELHPPDLGGARERLDRFLDAIACDELVLGGFSQGGMLALDALLRSDRRATALLLLSSSRIAFDEWRPYLDAGRVRGLRCFVSHGERDEDLAFSAGVALKDALVEAGADVTWLPFDGTHELPLVVWRRLRGFLMAKP